MATRYRAAFTLVELLVVIAIIATLVGLMLPAVLRAREHARVTQCANNQEQLGKAMINYEIARGHLPGYANNIRGTIVGWAPLMLPFIERADLWEGPTGNNGWRSGNPDISCLSPVSLFVCPSDTSTVSYPLSYVVNVGQGQPSPPSPAALSPPWPPSDDSTSKTSYMTQVGLFRNFTLTGQNGNVKQISMTDVKSASRRPMIAESAVDTTYAAMNPGRQWTETGVANVTALRFGFLFWPNTINPPSTTIPTPVVRPAPAGLGALLPIHVGLVNVTFCDGHTDQVADGPDTTCSSYDWADISTYP
jgi:prepilin-type N-terminal cleavage/methylation domain-containing protein/prepilin-type processing-associated H-X9-DG protein